MPYTVVSIIPIELNEIKNTLKPVSYHLDASDTKEPVVLVIPDNVVQSMFIPDRGKHGENIDFPTPAKEVAEAIVRDYIGASWMADVGRHPGLFCVEGEWDADDIKKKFKKELEEAREIQRAWFWALAKRADDDWNHFKQHKMIAPPQLLAAKFLGIRRAWTIDPLEEEMIECTWCTEFIPKRAKVCKNCHRELEVEASA